MKKTLIFCLLFSFNQLFAQKINLESLSLFVAITSYRDNLIAANLGIGANLGLCGCECQHQSQTDDKRPQEFFSHGLYAIAQSGALPLEDSL